MRKENQEHYISIKCGKTTDSFEKLKELCEKEAEALTKTLKVPEHTAVSVPCWTKDVPELIGVALFRKDNDGSVIYSLDFTETTL
ncbi:MAG: hypothetical protein J6B91_02655 [Prevotella sp.]|nr:hypothetical protein [Prevotella sp.]